jgi:methylglutaconyl-CoA hydratase
MSERLVAVSRRGPVAALELTDPGSGNALSGAMIAALTTSLAELVGDGSCRAVVLAGRGKHFCAGAHLGEMERLADASFEERLDDARALGRLYAALLRCPLLTLAALHGAAYGGGLGLAAACDLVVAGSDSRLQFSEVRLGFVPALISVFLPRRVAPARLAELFLDPHPMGAAEGQARGLVDEVVDHPLERAVERAGRIADKAAPSAIVATKQLLLEAVLPDLDALLERAARVNAEQRAHPECRQGVAHFLAQRDFPRWG